MCYKVDIRESSIDKIARYVGVAFAKLISAQRAGQAPLLNGFAHPDLPALIGAEPSPCWLSWGLLPSWVAPEKAAQTRKQLLNARAETLFEKPSFRESARKKRCVLVVSGFYEYRHEDNGSKTLYRLSRSDKDAMLLAGLWAECRGLRTCTIVTLEAQGLMSWVHNAGKRQPLMLEPEDIQAWLDSEVSAGSPFFKPKAYDIEAVTEK